MKNRFIIFIITLVLIILSSYAQLQEPSTAQTMADELPLSAPLTSQNNNIATQTKTDELVVPAAPVMEEPEKIEDTEQKEELTVDQTTEQEAIPQVSNHINIGLSADIRQKSATILNKLLSDEYVLYTKTLKYHWNIQGMVFHDFHGLFKEQYEKLFDFVDSIAERARALGAPALGSLHDFLTYTRLKEINGSTLTAAQMISNLLIDHETIIRSIREGIDATNQIGDQGTSNFLQDLIIKQEKIAWMLRATLK
jgi:starvation-inducible DNA-binding protein